MPAPIRRPQAVIFDMDGLLLDTEPLAARAWSDAAASLGVTFDRALALRMVGRNFVDCAAMARSHYAADYPVDALLAGWHAAYDAIVERDGLMLKPGATELIAWLEMQGIPRGVATSTRRHRALAKLDRTSLLHRFATVVGGDEVDNGKPMPDIYLEAARRLDVAPASCMALEDSEPGVRAAVAAGMTTVMVPDLAEPTDELRSMALVMTSLRDVQRRLASLAPDDMR